MRQLNVKFIDGLTTVNGILKPTHVLNRIVCEIERNNKEKVVYNDTLFSVRLFKRKIM